MLNLRRILRLHFVVVVLSMGSIAQAQETVTAFNTEPDDPFYRVSQEELSPGEHGHLIRQKEIMPPASLERARRNILAIYKSSKNDVSDTPTAISAIIAIPYGSKPDRGWPVVSWAHGTLGGADKCAPSMDNQLVANTSALVLHKKINHAPHVMLNAFLDAGWAVVMTDYEGLGTAGPHPYLNGESEARAILDAVRAAHQLRLEEQDTPLFSPSFAIVGHSQGGQAALFAAHYKPQWADELDLVGVAAIAPASKLSVLQFLPGLSLLDPKARESLPFLVLATQGALRGDPSLDLSKIFTPAGLSLFNETVNNACRTELSDSRWTQPNQKLFSHSVASVLNKQLKAMHPDLPVSVPIRISQAAQDMRVSAVNTRQLARELNITNAKSASAVCYKQYAAVAPGDPEILGDHFGILTTDINEMKAWLTMRFRHQPSGECESIPVG